MKLKKIASLALAGVMAVSMLAGCAGKTDTNTDTNTETSTGTDLAAVMDEFDGTGLNIEYTNDSHLSDVMEQVLKVYGVSAYTNDGVVDSSDFAKAVKKVGGFEDVKPDSTKIKNTTAGLTWSNGFIASNATAEWTCEKETGDLSGNTYTTYGMYAYKATTKEAAMNKYANVMSSAIKALSPALGTKYAHYNNVGVDGKYYEFSYKCPVGMASVKLADGTTAYFFLYEMNQTVSLKTVG